MPNPAAERPAQFDPDRAHVDFGRRSDDYAHHRTGPPWSLFDRLEAIVPLCGARALDLGTGPGFVALSLAERGATVTGVDKSTNQIEAARGLAADRGLDDRCAFRVAPAEDTGADDASLDLVTACQCWGWFDHGRALEEVDRVLRPGGVLAILQYCYLARQSPVARATEALVLRHNPAWAMADFDGLYPWQIDGVTEGGLKFIEQFSYDHDEPFSHQGWRGRIRTCNGVGSGTLTDADVEAFDADLTRLLAQDFPEEPLVIPHRVWSVVARKATGDAR